MGIPDHLTCLLRSLYAGQEATVRTRHVTTDWFKIGKRVCQGCVLIITLLSYLICRVHLEKCWTGWSTSWNQDCQEKYQSPQILRWHHPYGRKQRGAKKPLDEDERGNWKGWLKTQYLKNKDHGIWSHHFIANRWGNNGNRDFIFLGSKITAHTDCSHEINRCLLLGRKGMTNLDSILKSRDISLPTKVHIIKGMNHVWTWELDHKEDWAPNTWCFWTVVMEKTLESPLDCKIIPVNPTGKQL